MQCRAVLLLALCCVPQADRALGLPRGWVGRMRCAPARLDRLLPQALLHKCMLAALLPLS